MARIRNRERFRRLLLALPKEERNQIKPALREAAAEIVATQKQLVRVDEGETRDSIRATSGDQDLATYMSARKRAVTRDPEMTMVISAGNPVSGKTNRSDAHLLEYGTSSMAPKPFFGPGFRAHRQDAIRKINRAVRKAIKVALQRRGAGG